MNAIDFNGKNSLMDFGAVITKRNIGYPARKIVEETVPYSSVTYDFSALYGENAYSDRTLEYEFSIVCSSPTELHRRISRFINWLYSPTEKLKLHDYRDEEYDFMARCTSAVPETNATAGIVSVTFSASPYKYPIASAGHYTLSSAPYPDINGDGVVNASDAAEILTAASLIGAGMDSGLTAEQERLADADGDGRITATDAALVQAFISSVGIGEYPNTPEGWVQFRNDSLAQEESL
jgi:hypothetical protein